MRGVRRQHRHLAPLGDHPPDQVVRQHGAQDRLGLVEDPGVLRVEEEAKPLCAGHLGDVTVPEVEPEELGVGLWLEHDPPRAPTAKRTPRRRPLFRDVARLAPVADRGARYVEPSRDLAVVEPCRDQSECLFSDLRRPHEHMFAWGSDGPWMQEILQAQEIAVVERRPPNRRRPVRGERGNRSGRHGRRGESPPSSDVAHLREPVSSPRRHGRTARDDTGRTLRTTLVHGRKWAIRAHAAAGHRRSPRRPAFAHALGATPPRSR